jgi:hypothetical protein
MRIHEILYRNNETADVDRSDPYRDFPPASFNSLGRLASAFTRRRGLVKYLWNLDGSEEQPFRPAPPDSEAKVIPSGELEPNMASWEAEPVKVRPTAGPDRLDPFPNDNDLSRSHVYRPPSRF